MDRGLLWKIVEYIGCPSLCLSGGITVSFHPPFFPSEACSQLEHHLRTRWHHILQHTLPLPLLSSFSTISPEYLQLNHDEHYEPKDICRHRNASHRYSILSQIYFVLCKLDECRSHGRRRRNGSSGCNIIRQ